MNLTWVCDDDAPKLLERYSWEEIVTYMKLMCIYASLSMSCYLLFLSIFENFFPMKQKATENDGALQFFFKDPK